MNSVTKIVFAVLLLAGPCMAQAPMSIALDGSADYADTGSADLGLTTSSTLSIAAWVYPLGQTSGQAGLILNDYNRTAVSGWLFSFNPDRTCGATKLDSGGSRAMSSAAMTTNAWHHVAAIIYPGNVTPDVYLDGVLSNVTPASALTVSILPLGSGNVTISRESVYTSPQRYFRGTIADVCAWNRAVTAQEIGRMYATRHGWVPRTNLIYRPENPISQTGNDLTGKALYSRPSTATGYIHGGDDAPHIIRKLGGFEQ